MSVATTFTLPAQPTTGSYVRVPLGGDGFTAPHSAITLRAITLAHDVTGNFATMSCVLDDRYCSLVSFSQMVIAQAVEVDEVVRCDLSGSSTPTIRENINLLANATRSDANGIWYPPSWILPGTSQRCTLSWSCANTDGDDSQWNALIYQFDIRVRELTNVGFLNWARGPMP